MVLLLLSVSLRSRAAPMELVNVEVIASTPLVIANPAATPAPILAMSPKFFLILSSFPEAWSSAVTLILISLAVVCPYSDEPNKPAASATAVSRRTSTGTASNSCGRIPHARYKFSATTASATSLGISTTVPSLRTAPPPTVRHSRMRRLKGQIPSSPMPAIAR